MHADTRAASVALSLLAMLTSMLMATHHHDGDIRQHIISDRPLTVDE